MKKILYTVYLKDTKNTYRESMPLSSLSSLFGGMMVSPTIQVAARSFSEAIEETQKAYGDRWAVIGIMMSDRPVGQPMDIV